MKSNEITKILKVNKEEYYIKHLSIVSCLLPTYLTKTEIKVLANFLALDDNITRGDMFNTLARKKVKENLDNMSSGSLTNHLSSMISKQVIDKDENNRLSVKSFLLPNNKEQIYMIKIKNKDVS